MNSPSRLEAWLPIAHVINSFVNVVLDLASRALARSERVRLRKSETGLQCCEVLGEASSRPAISGGHTQDAYATWRYRHLKVEQYRLGSWRTARFLSQTYMARCLKIMTTLTYRLDTSEERLAQLYSCYVKCGLGSRLPAK
jgi:hypothetical protein